MPFLYKILGQSNPGNALTELYIVPEDKSAICTSYFICNTSAESKTFEVSIVKSGDNDLLKQKIFSGELSANETLCDGISIALSTGDKIKVLASTDEVTFNFFGQEV